MSTFNPQPPVKLITIQDPYVKNSHSIPAYLKEVKENRIKRAILLSKLEKHTMPDNVRVHLLGCPNESLQVAIRHLDRCVKSNTNNPSWAYLLDL